MSVIKRKIPILTQSKVIKKLTDEILQQLIKSGLNSAQTSTIITKVVILAKNKMSGEYTVMGGYSAEQQLYDKAKELLFQLDEQEKLVELLNESKSDEIAESDLEDVYSAIDALAFTGSEKQINWARSIATKSCELIAQAWKEKDFSLPKTASWWIDNRTDIYSALTKL